MFNKFYEQFLGVKITENLLKAKKKERKYLRNIYNKIYRILFNPKEI